MPQIAAIAVATATQAIWAICRRTACTAPAPTSPRASLIRPLMATPRSPRQQATADVTDTQGEQQGEQGVLLNLPTDLFGRLLSAGGDAAAEPMRRVVDLFGGALGAVRGAHLQMFDQASDVALQRGEVVAEGGEAGIRAIWCAYGSGSPIAASLFQRPRKPFDVQEDGRIFLDKSELHAWPACQSTSARDKAVNSRRRFASACCPQVACGNDPRPSQLPPTPRKGVATEPGYAFPTHGPDGGGLSPVRYDLRMP
jgi:hypothetical protein